ncbi:M48 family metalloprotease [Nodosilinea nodulosa]|uniref:M48 family metalloprotease n=1 Tax=Nodosilinea nodulosa TaxID=416001 RepID=UPI000308F052|nr:M48 family metalloprotease [Nodosilinea nodulosa]
MAQPIDPNSQRSGSDRPAKPSVEAFYQRAVAAFKAQNYDQALALFRQLNRLPTGSPYYIKALMGRVRAHQHLGQVDQATLLCRQLLESSSPQASQWASRVLGQLSEKTAIAASPDPQPGTTAAGDDLSGFVPLGDAGKGAQHPLGSLPNPSGGTTLQRGPAAASNPPPVQDAPEAGLQSLFHYQQLNQQSSAALGHGQPPASTSFSHTTPAPPPGRIEGPPARLQPQPPLPKHPLGLWLGQGLTAIALVWAINWIFHFALRTLDHLLRWVRWPMQLSLPGAYQSYTAWVVTSLVLLALASPWLLDFALAFWYRQRPLSIRQLQTHSPGALRPLRQVCRQQGCQLPELRVIADPAPLCFSYGWLPRNTRLVISQGLLDQVSDQSLTTLYSYELARTVNGSLPVLSVVGLLLLLLHTGYRWLAQRADTLTQPLGRGILGSMASLLYGLFWLLRQTVLWLSRLCCRWGDRRAVSLTQHPDQIAEVLLQTTAAIAAHLQRHGTLHPLHSSLEILMPISSRQAITAGSFLGDSAGDRGAILSTLVALDGLSPYRHWLRANASHPPLGERLLWLNQQGALRGQANLIFAVRDSRSAAKVSLPLLLLQKGPLAGLIAGGSLAMALWFVGGTVNRLGWEHLSWLYQDKSVLAGGMWLGLGIGLLLRINTLFPEASTPSASTKPVDTVATLLQSSSALPVQGQPVSLRGKLHGLSGTGNWGCQELYLNDSSSCSVKLVNPFPLGSLQGLFQPHAHPFNWVGRMVTVTGWSRYGSGMLWVDINQVQLDQRHRFSTYGPAWATLISLASSLIGIMTIFGGG